MSDLEIALADALLMLLNTPTARKQAWDVLERFDAEKLAAGDGIRSAPATDEAQRRDFEAWALTDVLFCALNRTANGAAYKNSHTASAFEGYLQGRKDERAGMAKRGRGLDAGGEAPLFWYRPCTDGTYEGPIHDARMEKVRKESGAWVPLVAADKAPMAGEISLGGTE